MANSTIQKIKDAAERLAAVRREIAEMEERHKAEMDPLKAQREACQQELIELLEKNELKSIKTSSGENVSYGTSKSVEVVSEPHALKWAIEQRAVTINKTIVKQKLAKMPEAPPGFQVVERPFISIRKPKPEPAPATAGDGTA